MTSVSFSCFLLPLASASPKFFRSRSRGSVGLLTRSPSSSPSSKVRNSPSKSRPVEGYCAGVEINSSPDYGMGASILNQTHTLKVTAFTGKYVA